MSSRVPGMWASGGIFPHRLLRPPIFLPNLHSPVTLSFCASCCSADLKFAILLPLLPPFMLA